MEEPCPSEMADYDHVCYDSVTGASLPSKLCEEAMQLEINNMKEMNVHTPCEHGAVKEQGPTPIGTRWVFTNKGDTEHRKRTSIICASNLLSSQWNITSEVHKIRTMLKRRSNLHACIGKPLPPQKRENPGLLESSSGGSGNSSSNPLSIHPRTKSIFLREKSFQRTEFGLQFLDDRRAENTPSTLSSSSMSGSTP